MFHSMLESIGNTPLIRLDRIKEKLGLEGSIYAKLEYWSPGLSKKDRVAMQMIEDAEANGTLKPGQPVVELTSGNMGTGLAIVCKLKGYQFIAVMSTGNSIERRVMMEAFGAEVVLVDQCADSIPGQVSGRDLALVEEEAQRLTKKHAAFRADQFFNSSTYRVGELKIAEEIIAQTDVPFDLFVDFMGTAGSFIGVTRRLKREYPEIKCFGLEPWNARKYYSPKDIGNGRHKIQGGGYNMDLPFLTEENLKLVEGFMRIKDEEAVAAARLMAEEEGIFAGFSSGANLAGALKLLQGEHAGKSIVILTPDSGTKYLSTDLWK